MLIKFLHPDGEVKMILRAVGVKPLHRGFTLAFCQDRLVIVSRENVVVDSLDVIEFIKDYL